MDPIRNLKSEVPVLFYSSILAFALALITGIGLIADTRLVLGENPWIKPIKFDLSFAIYF